MERAGRDLLATQRSDGGWSQIPTDASDAYATGQALVALQQVGGLGVESEAFQLGIDYLLRTQLDDGSWLVKTRRQSPGLPYFETGFPHRRHQFISTAATAWATTALLTAVDPKPSQPFRGPRPKARERDLGFEPVHIAAAFGPYAELERLLASGADPNARGPDDLRPLHLAVHDARAVALLVEHGAEIDPRTAEGMTPLMLAAWYGTEDRAAHLLVEHGADVRAAYAEGRDVLLSAVENGKHRLIRTLAERGVDLGAVDPESGSALHWAATGNDLATARLLLELGVPVDGEVDGMTPLHWAAYDGKSELVALLLAAGADPDAEDDEGMTPLNWAARVEHGDARTVELLLRAGADPTIPGLMDRTPLEWARKVGNEPAIEALEKALAETKGH